MQEQQQKMWQDNLRRQQMYVYYQSRQQKKYNEKKFFSCSVCGSIFRIKSCPFCRRFFCSPHLSIIKIGSTGHQCVTSKPIPKKLSQPQIPSKTPTKKPVEKAQNKKDARDETLDWLEHALENDDFES
jgi:hypothetical protein